MNKLFTKIAAAGLSLAMAVGVGVAVGSNAKQAKQVNAASDTLAMSSLSSSDSNISAVAAKSNGSNAPITATVNTHSGVRMYANNTLTITSSQNITSLTIPWYKNGSKTFADVSVESGGGTYTHASSSGQSGTWTGSSKEIVLKVGSSGQVQLYEIQYVTAASKTLSSIALSGTYPTTFTQGDAFSHTGMTVTATYSDSTTGDVTSSASFSGYNMSTTGNQTVTVSYTESGTTKTTSYSITVNAPSKTLSSIAITTPPTKTSYEAGETFDSTGMVVTATYSDASTAPVTGSCTFSPSGALTTSDDEITVSYTYGGTTKTATQAITVTQPSSITLDPTVTSSFPYQGITLSVTSGTLTNGTDYRVYKGGETLTITSTVGDIATINLTYQSASYDGGGWASSYSPNASSWTSPATTSGTSGEQARITMIVIELASADPVTSLSITGSMTKTSYNQNEAWDPSGFTVNAYYQSAPSTPVDVTSSVQWSYDPATTASTATTSVIATASFGGQTANSLAQSVTISAPSYTNTTNLNPGNYYIKYGSDYLTGVSGGKGSLGAKLDAIVFTFALVGNDTWEVTNESNYLYIIDDSKGLKLDSTQTSITIGWENESNLTRYLRGAGSRDIAYFSGGPDLRTYVGKTDGTNGMTLESAKTISGFSVYSTGANKNVLKGTTFDSLAASAAGFQARLNYTDSTFDDVTSYATWSLDTSTVGTATLTVTYESYDAVTFNDMNIYVVTIVSLTIDSSSAKTTGYWTGDTLVTAGLIITGKDSSNNEYPISYEDCTYSPTILSTAGSQTITVTYTNENSTTATGTYSVSVTAFAYQLASSINGGDRVIFASTETYGKYLSGIANTIGTATDYTGKPGTEFYFDVVAGVNDGTVAFKDSTGNYLNGATATKLSLTSSISDETSWTVQFSENVPTITNVSNTNNVLKYNASSPRFCAYANANATFVNIYKLIGTSGQSAAETWATSFNNDVVNGVCKPYDDDFDTKMPTAWSAKATTYAALSAEAKAYIASKNPSASGDSVEKALYEYNRIYSTYGTELSLENFIGRTEPVKAAAKVNSVNAILNGVSSNITAIIVIVSLVSLTAIGGYFAIRKRKEQ